METKIIYSKRIAVELRKRGFKILEVQVNEYHPEFNCWVFEASPELFKALDELM